MLTKGRFNFLGVEKAMGKTKTYLKVGLLQGMKSYEFNVDSEELYDTLEALKPMTQIIVDLKTTIGKDYAFSNVMNFVLPEEKIK